MSTDTPPDRTPASCSLVGPVALVVQALMAVIVIASLLVKRQYEGNQHNGTARRRWKVWMYDVSKQLIGQSLIHGSNLLISDQVAHEGGNNPCSLYFLNVLVDTTIGVLVLYLALKGLTKASTAIWGKEGFLSGVYGHPPRIKFWLRQLGIYLAALLVMKLFVLALFAVALDGVLLPLAGWILNWMQEWTQVVFVMAVFPLLMNVIQFCLIDSLIKGREESTASKDGYDYTRAPTQPKDLEEATEPTTHDTPRRPPIPADHDSERGRSRSRTNSRARSRTSRPASSRPLTPLPPPSPLLHPIPSSSPPSPPNRRLHLRSEAMRRTPSNDAPGPGYGSTGSTNPSPVPRAAMLSDDDVFPLGEGETGARAPVDPDTTPQVDGTSSRFPALSVAPSRIDDQFRIQARRSLSSEETPCPPRGAYGWRRGSEGGAAGITVMLDDV